jgi:hypothetical protein
LFRGRQMRNSQHRKKETAEAISFITNSAGEDQQPP